METFSFIGLHAFSLMKANFYQLWNNKVIYFSKWLWNKVVNWILKKRKNEVGEGNNTRITKKGKETQGDKIIFNLKKENNIGTIINYGTINISQ